MLPYHERVAQADLSSCDHNPWQFGLTKAMNLYLPQAAQSGL